MSENKPTQGFRDKAEKLGEDLPISAELFTKVADRMDDLREESKESYSWMDLHQLVLTCLSDVMWSVAKIEGQLRGIEVIVEPVNNSD